MNVHGYGLMMSSVTKSVSVANILATNFQYWAKIANTALFKNFDQYGDGDDLVTDVWASFSKKENLANQAGFAETTAEAECMIGRTIQLYAKNAKYIPALAELAKIKAANGENVTIVGWDAISETLTAPADTSSAISIDALYAKKFTCKWDQMCDDGELTTEQKLDIIKKVAALYVTCKTDDERQKVVNTVRDLLDLGEDTPEEYKQALYDILAAQ